MGTHQPSEALLRALPGVQVVQQARVAECCGFGGTFSARHPAISGAMVSDKLDSIRDCGADVLVSADCGCLLNLHHAAEKRRAAGEALPRCVHLGAQVLHSGEADWPRIVRQALTQRGCRRIAVGAASCLPPGLDGAMQGLQVRSFDTPLEQWKAELFDAVDAVDAVDADITAAEAGIADTGTLVLRPSAREPRTLSLVPPLHVAVLQASRLYAGLPAAIAAVTAAQDDIPTNLVLITGPSKTANIQLVLAFGAHGPKELVIVLVNGLSTAEAPR